MVGTGGDRAASILAPQALRDLGVKQIYVEVTSREAARALEAIGVTETICPEREVALPHVHGIQVVALYDVLTSEMNVVPEPDRPDGGPLATAVSSSGTVDDVDGSARRRARPAGAPARGRPPRTTP